MPNPNSPYGIKPYAYMSGAPYNGATRVYYVPANNGTALFLGDPLLVINGADAFGVPAIGIAAAGSANSSPITGAFQGVANNAGEVTIPVLQGQPVYLPANTAAYIYVSDDPFLLYSVQEDSVGGAMAATAASQNVDLVAGTGSAITGISGWQLKSSTVNTTAALQMRVIQALQEIDNAIGVNCKWLVKTNYSSLLSTTGV